MATSSQINTLRFRQYMCINCEMCVNVCPHGVFAPGDKFVQLVNRDACMECGACQRNCPTEAITVDSGVGCAAAMIRAALLRQKEPTCGGSNSSCCGS